MFTLYRDKIQLSVVLSLTGDELRYQVEDLESPCDSSVVFLALKLLFAVCGMHRPVLAQKRSHSTSATKKTKMRDSLAHWHVQVNTRQGLKKPV